MQHYKAVIAYDGSAFCGFAEQKAKNTVLGTLKESFYRVGIDSEIIGASRTDKGVHATRQVISFSNAHLHIYSLDSLRALLNAKLYPHIYIRSLCKAHSDFHPRFCAKWRAYRFVLSPSHPNPFIADYVTYAQMGDISRFRSALKCFLGEHNFMYFKKNGTRTKDDIRRIFYIATYQYKHLHIVYIRGNGFLRSQVRLMVGAALSVSRGEMSLNHLHSQLLAQSRHYHYPIAPQGLYLCGIGY